MVGITKKRHAGRALGLTRHHRPSGIVQFKDGFNPCTDHRTPFGPLVTERNYESAFSEGREELVANSRGIR